MSDEREDHSAWARPRVRDDWQNPQQHPLAGPKRPLCEEPAPVPVPGDSSYHGAPYGAPPTKKPAGRRLWPFLGLGFGALFVVVLAAFCGPDFVSLATTPCGESCLQARPEVQAAYNDPDACAGEVKRVCLVPLGSVSLGLLQYLTDYYLDRYGLEVHVLPPLDIPLSSFDRDRGQVLVDNLYGLMYDHYRRWNYDGKVTMIGLTSVDIFPADQSFMFSTYNKAQQRGLVSSARMNPKFLGLSVSGEGTARLRVRKKLNVQIGVMHYGMQPSLEWGSALKTTYSLAEIDYGAADLPISKQGALALSPPAPPRGTPSPQASPAPEVYCTTDCFTPSPEIVSAFADENACAGSEKRICIVPVGAVDPTLLQQYIDYFLERYGVRIHVLPPLSVNDSMLNVGRMQVIPEALDALVTTRYGSVVADPNVTLLTVTAVDIYYSALSDVPYALMVPGPFVSIPTPRRSLISYARLGDKGADTLALRFQKLANRELGELYLGRAPEDNRESAMYGALSSVPQLDEMAANLTFRR